MTLPCQRSPRLIKQWTILTVSCLIFISLGSCGSQSPSLLPLASPTGTSTPSLSPTEIPTQTPYIITATSQVASPEIDAQGIFFLAMADSGHIHIFAYSPQKLSFTRLTNGDWDDIAPAISPDGGRLAFASNRNGYWNIYSLDLQNGDMSMLSDSLEYKGDPSWSSDGAWVTYDSYVNGNLEIFLRSTADIKQPPTQLTTQDGSLDSSPAWSPQGRHIAFISDRSGEPEVGVTNLDIFGSFMDVSLNPHAVESHPSWSPDGSLLAWAATDSSSGLTGIYLWDSRIPDTPARLVGSGNWPVWQDSDHLASLLVTPNQFFLTAFSTNGSLSLPPILLPGPVEGLAYGNVTMSLPGPFEDISRVTPSPLYETVLNPQADAIPGRSSLAPLSGVQAPHPQLHELADDSFQALRNQVAVLTGWDALASLENAFVPLTTSLDPGLGEDWLYTGRAFTLNPALIDAGWMAIVREDFGQQTYWRIYLRTTAQDGSEGLPLSQIPWDFSARSGDPVAYENGGRLMGSIPSGYWFDLTALAMQYGWERLPALTNWRTYYSGARFTELAFTQGLDWRSAMLQLYPPDVLVTPTVVIPPTRTPTRTPPFYRSPTPTQTTTHRPTRTP
jgi:TolB protein